MRNQNEELTLNDKIKFDNKGGAILGVLEGPVADFIHPTRNGRHYSEELWENVLKNPIVQEQFKNGGIVGELDHPEDREGICTEKVAVIMPEPPMKKNGQYYGKFNILDTPCGRIVHTLAKAGFKLGVSSRGTGDVDQYTDEVDPSTYEFTCFDVVLLPAVESARMQLVTEGLDTKKVNYKKLLKESLETSSEQDREVMTQTLEHLNIQLDEDMEKKTCVICGKEFEGFGNNAQPVKDGICCDECNAKEVIPARLKKMGLKEGFKLEIKGPEDAEFRKPDQEGDVDHVKIPEDFWQEAQSGKPVEWEEDGWHCKLIKEDLEEPEVEIPDTVAEVEVSKDIIEPETLDDIEIEQECKPCIDDDKLIEFLHQFLDKEGLELDGEGEEEEHFVELFHEIVCPECSEEGETEEVEAPEDKEAVEDEHEVEDVESSEILEQLQNLLKENSDLKEELKTLQNEKAVSGAKVSKLTEDLNNFKSVAASAGKKVLEMKSLETKFNDLDKENTSLKEELSKVNEKVEQQESHIHDLESGKQILGDMVAKQEAELKGLREELSSKTSDSDQKLVKAKEIIQKTKGLAEQYKKLAHQNANRYIEMRAQGLGISKNEIINRLNESYTLDDVDELCEDLQEYSLNISSLPFAFDKPGNARVRIREDHSKDPLKNIDSEYDDTVDDYLLDLAGLKK